VRRDAPRVLRAFVRGDARFPCATIGIPAPTWLAAGILIPFGFLGGLAGRPIGDRLGADAFAMLAIALLAVAGAYTLGAAGRCLCRRLAKARGSPRARETRARGANPARISFGSTAPVCAHRARTRSTPTIGLPDGDRLV